MAIVSLKAQVSLSERLCLTEDGKLMETHRSAELPVHIRIPPETNQLDIFDDKTITQVHGSVGPEIGK